MLMQYNVMNVLMFIFERYYENETHLQISQEKLEDVLEEAGFADDDIDRALWWLDGLVELCDDAENGALTHAPGFRVSSPQEQVLLPMDCQSYMVQLEQLGILDDYSREMVIDRTLALTDGPITLDSLKWVAQMVLFNLPGREHAYNSIKNMEHQPIWH